MTDENQSLADDRRGLSRRATLALPAAGVGIAAIGAVISQIPSAEAATPPGDSLMPAQATKLRALADALAKAPRRRDFKSVPMILTSAEQYDSEALHLLFTYAGGPKQVWDNTDLESPWLNLMRNSMNAQIWSWPDLVLEESGLPRHLGHAWQCTSRSLRRLYLGKIPHTIYRRKAQGQYVDRDATGCQS